MDTISPLIKCSELAARLDDPSLLLFDVTVELPSPRFDGDYRVESGREGWKQGHIPGATYLDLIHDFSVRDASFSFALPPLAELACRFEGMGLQDGLTPVLYDRTDGFWAARFWWMLRSVGKAARVLDGGYRGWLSESYPVLKGEPEERPSGLFTSVLNPISGWIGSRYRKFSKDRSPGPCSVPCPKVFLMVRCRHVTPVVDIFRAAAISRRGNC